MFQELLVNWAKHKFKHLKRNWAKARAFMREAARKQPALFVHWELGFCI
jgi:RNA-directed DNA polymerase